MLVQMQIEYKLLLFIIKKLFKVNIMSNIKITKYVQGTLIS